MCGELSYLRLTKLTKFLKIIYISKLRITVSITTYYLYTILSRSYPDVASFHRFRLKVMRKARPPAHLQNLNMCKITAGKHLRRSLFLNKVAAFGRAFCKRLIMHFFHKFHFRLFRLARLELVVRQ